MARADRDQLLAAAARQLLGVVEAMATPRTAPARPRREITVKLELRDGDVVRRCGLPPYFDLHSGRGPIDLRRLEALAERSPEDLGRKLLEALLGPEKEPSEVLSKVYGRRVSDPLRHAFRARIRTEDEELRALPWALCRWRDHLLADHGWTFELAAGDRPRPAEHLHTPCRALMVAGGEIEGLPLLRADAHQKSLESLLGRAWKLPLKAELLHRARSRAELEAELEPRRSLAVVEAPSGEYATRALAAALIDSGSADVVLVGRDALDRLDELLGTLADQWVGQLLYIRAGETSPEPSPGFRNMVSGYAVVTAADPSLPTGRLAKMDGIFSAEQVWAPWLDDRSASSFFELSNCPWQEGVHTATEMPFVRICEGRFRMGSENEELSAWGKETPAHDVSVGGFWIGQTEVTNAQYRVIHPDHRGDDNRPAVNVSWYQARDYCRSLGQTESWVYDLPTEAEWEYAARTGTTTAWSFGDDEEDLGDYAWFRENSENEAHEVGTKKPNPWGLYDVHGNVWEWVRDCYEDNADRADPEGAIPDSGLVDGSCHQSETPGASRVLRGGAFNVGPGGLRSAVRSGGGPGVENPSFGFRCVRRPVRQP